MTYVKSIVIIAAIVGFAMLPSFGKQMLAYIPSGSAVVLCPGARSVQVEAGTLVWCPNANSAHAMSVADLLSTLRN